MHLNRSPDAIFVANILAGSLAAVAAYVALTAIARSWPAANASVETWKARLMAVALALHPLFVRVSASDGSHTWGLLLFWMGGLCAIHHSIAGSRVSVCGLALAVY
jgi:hypothetical protein